MSFQDLLSSFSSLKRDSSAGGGSGSGSDRLQGSKRTREEAKLDEKKEEECGEVEEVEEGEEGTISMKQSSSSSIPPTNPIPNRNRTDVSPQEVRLSGEFATIGNQCGTDKITHHGYHRFYPRFIEHYRHLPEGQAMLEIGMENCKSLQLWKSYFTNLFIYGIDINFSLEEERARIFKVDQSKADQLQSLIKNDIKHPLCFIIDDGSHIPEHQVLAFDILFPHLLPGGTYIIEDVETSYWTRGGLYGYTTRYGYKHNRSCIETFKTIVDDINREFLRPDNLRNVDNNLREKISNKTRDLISSVSFAHNAIIVVKKTEEEVALYADRRYRFEQHL
eukprot:gene3809-4159_t